MDDTRPVAPEDQTASGPAGDGPGAEPRRWRIMVGRAVTALAALLVVTVLVAPSRFSTPAAFLRIPAEGLIAVALILAVPARARRVIAVSLGVALGVLAIVKIFDIGFYAVLDRPFDPVLDWSFVKAGVVFLSRSAGRGGAIGAVIAAFVLAGAVLVLVTLSVLRLSGLVIRHRFTAIRTAGVLAFAWVGCAVLGVEMVAGVPVAAHPFYDRFVQVRAGFEDQDVFAREIANDPYRNTPGPDLLTELRGKDVIISFVESYGRVAVEDPDMAPRVGALLEAGDRRLAAKGFAARSAFLTSSTAGGGSWLAQATLLSGLWVDNQQRYDDLLLSDRLTLNTAFRRAGWRSVGIMPGVIEPWPQGAFFGFDRLYAAADLGYRGPNFSFATMPDQYTLSAFQRTERAAGHPPVMAEIPLISSHAPWSPIPSLIDWKKVGDGSVFKAAAGAGDPADVILQRGGSRVRADYERSIEYSLNTLISYVDTYGGDNLVLVFLGDHQPSPVVTGQGASRDVPITIVAHDPAVLDRIAGWGWLDGLKPGPDAPVWRMDTFRDRFLAAFSPRTGAVPAATHH
jgi:hypothetical protein